MAKKGASPVEGERGREGGKGERTFRRVTSAAATASGGGSKDPAPLRTAQA